MPLYNNTETHEPTLRDAGVDPVQPSPVQDLSRVQDKTLHDVTFEDGGTTALKQRIVVVDPKLRDEVHVR